MLYEKSYKVLIKKVKEYQKLLMELKEKIEIQNKQIDSLNKEVDCLYKNSDIHYKKAFLFIACVCGVLISFDITKLFIISSEINKLKNKISDIRIENEN